jgi:hypothetical protein
MEQPIYFQRLTTLEAVMMPMVKWNNATCMFNIDHYFFSFEEQLGMNRSLCPAILCFEPKTLQIEKSFLTYEHFLPAQKPYYVSQHISMVRLNKTGNVCTYNVTLCTFTKSLLPWKSSVTYFFVSECTVAGMCMLACGLTNPAYNA